MRRQTSETGSINRRGFLGGLAAAAACPTLADDGKPLFKVGLVTDINVRETRTSCERLELAYRLFKDHGVEMIVNCGDIANTFAPKAYAHYCDIRRETYPDPATAPKEIYVWANHDRMAYPEDDTKDKLLAFPKVKKLLGIPNEAYDEFVFKGFTFLVFPQWLDWNRYEATIAKACAANPGKPVFIFDHVPPVDTTENSRSWGSPDRRRILSKFPQVINISGHAHGSLRNEQNIWQGAFTDVSVGCLAQWNGDNVGRAQPTLQNWSCIVMEVYPSKAVFRRFELKDRFEIGANAPWTVSWPYDPANAPYDPKRLRATRPRPQFPAGAKLSLKVDREPFSSLAVSFPAATDTDTTFLYRLELARRDADGKWITFACRETRGEYHLPAAARGATLTDDAISAGYFTPGETCRISVTPVNFWGGEGKPISAEWTPPAAKALERVWEGVPAPARPGEKFSFNGGEALFSFPEGVWAKIPVGAKVRLTADLLLEQRNVRGVNFGLFSKRDYRRSSPAIHTPKGYSDLRYVVDFRRVATKYPLDFRMRQGDRLKVLFRRLALDRIA